MTSVNKPAAETDLCPNCQQPVTVPKSTRSFICRSCEAVIKVINKDNGVELKVVGKSVDDDPTYRALESEVAALKAELADLHARYLVEAAREYGSGGTVLRNVGVLVALVGLVWAIFSLAVGAAVFAAGVVLVAVGVAVNSSKKRAKQAATGELTEAMNRVGARRDLLQRKAARIKTEV